MLQNKYKALRISNNIYPSHAVYPIGSEAFGGSGVQLARSGVNLAGAGFGNGTRRKIIRGVKKGGCIAFGLTEAFGTPEQAAQARAIAQTANTTNTILQGGCADAGAMVVAKKRLPAAKLRAMF